MTLSKPEQIVGTVISFFAIILLGVYVLFAVLGIKNEEILLIVFGSLFIGTLSLCIILYQKYRKEENPLFIDYLNIGTQRHILGLFMIFYGVPKLLGNFFDYQLFAIDSKVFDLSEFELAWYFYGKNKWQELFSGIMEFIPGILLLNRRTYYVASLVLLPVTSQVFILNLFFHIGGITFPAAAILIACNLYIIYSEKGKILAFFRSLDFSRKVSLSRNAFLMVRTGKWAIIVSAVLLVGTRLKTAFLNPATK